VHRKHKYIGKNSATKFQLIAEKTAKNLGGGYFCRTRYEHSRREMEWKYYDKVKSSSKTFISG